MIYIGLDDTDNKTSRGTGRLARQIAAALSRRYQVMGVTRHQLLFDPRVPYTSHNSSAAIHLQENGHVDLNSLTDEIQELMLADWQDGSDPGLCVARIVVDEMTEFGKRAKRWLVAQSEARAIAERCGCLLRGLGGTQDGVIGALAAVGLAASGEDGRFILVGTSRELTGMQSVEAILQSGITEVCSMEGQPLQSGTVDTGGKLRPAFRGGKAILFVERQMSGNGYWLPVKLE